MTVKVLQMRITGVDEESLVSFAVDIQSLTCLFSCPRLLLAQDAANKGDDIHKPRASDSELYFATRV